VQNVTNVRNQSGEDDMQCTIPFGIGMLLKNAIIDTSYPHEGSQ
jgi:hypothetical protein